MTDQSFRLTRRRVLAGIGAVGAAGAAAGLGTSAYLSDTESFEENTIAAGELDLTVDWEEHYWNDFDAGVDIQHVDSADDVGDDQVGLPDPSNPMVAVSTDSLSTFMDATAIEAFPDSNDDGVQDDLGQYEACQDFAQMPDDLYPNGQEGTSGLRSSNTDTWIDMEEDVEAPLVNLNDVKPGDFGELTLSFHLCDNPGYVWLQGRPVRVAENGHTEPEAEADGEEGSSSESKNINAAADVDDLLNSNVELLDAIETLLWYDEDGDNVYEPGGQEGEEVDVVLVLDRSGSMSGSKNQEMRTAAKNLVDALNLGSNAGQVGVVSFADEEELEQGLSTDASAVKTAIDGVGASGSTNLEGGVNGAEEELTDVDISQEITASGNDRDNAEKIMVVLSDGSPNVDDNEVGGADGDDDPVDEATRAKDNGIDIYTIGFGVSTGTSTADTLEDMASSDEQFYLGDEGELEQIFGQISQQIGGEEAFFRGTLRELLDEVSDGHGIPLDGDRASSFDEVSDPADADSRDEFVNSTNNFIGLAWWLPRTVGNEIQGDSVGFDLGFYTEQSRHNDGSGPNTTTATTTSD